LHGTSEPEWQKRSSSVDKYFENYEGYISSHDYQRADDQELANIAAQIHAVAK
jgi:hypothetical protein